jgi:alpha-glucan phosphorylase-like protein
VRVGHVRLILLDTDLAANAERDRHVTHRLYGGDREVRILQEIVLGIGGVRALGALGLRPTVWHMNEGHAAFLVLERIRQHMHAGLEFAQAIETVAANTVFTTHTAVEAGHDRFSETLVPHVLRLLRPRDGPESAKPVRSGQNRGQQRLRHDGAGGARLALSKRGLQDTRRRERPHAARPVAADPARRKPADQRDQRGARADLPVAGLVQRF